MAQPTQITPTVTASLSGAKQQVPLRDYLNVRIAPFLKKAINECLDAEAEYPLQWLGEHLIQQSMLFEGNPDKTGIQERFAYEHPVAAPEPQPVPVVPAAEAVAMPEPSVETRENGTPQPADQVMDQAQPEGTAVNGTAVQDHDGNAAAQTEDTEMTTEP